MAKSIYLTIRVDFDTDSQEQAEQWATELMLCEERPSKSNRIENIEICGFND